MNFDPPSDPYGNDRQCRICDADMERDSLTREWYCPVDHDALEIDDSMDLEEEEEEEEEDE